MSRLYDICYVDFPYEDNLSNKKRRPVLIIDDKTFVFVGAKITGTKRESSCALEDWQDEGLKKPSYVELDKWYPLSEGEISQVIGHLTDRDIENVKKAQEELRDSQKEVHTEAHHYGGVFDIRDDQYFTRDDLDELIDFIESVLNDHLVGDKVTITDADITDQVLNLEITSDKDGFVEEYHKKIDMRKVKTPRDLIRVYGKDAILDFQEKFESDGIEFSLSEVVSESITDVVQTAPYVIVPVGMFGQYKYVTPDGEIILTTDVSETGEVSVSGIEDKKDYFKDTYEIMRDFESDLSNYLESEDKE